jgi:hypothetical protein
LRWQDVTVTDRDKLARAIHDVQCHAWLTGQRQFCKDHPNTGHLAAADAAIAWQVARTAGNDADVTAAAQRVIATAFTYHPGNRTGTPESREPISMRLAATALQALHDAGYVVSGSAPADG